ncbi:LAFA_0A07448g1_1 [Lachancea sp. 'fantastica']|nr:LAFA_0A07448g1_1 [Lachancea sp. 'fantastica']
MSFRLSKSQWRSIEGENDEIKPEFEETAGEGDEEIKESRLQSLISLLASSPYDIFLQINEQIESVDWDSKAERGAKRTGNLLTASFFVTRLLQDNLIKPNIHNIGKKHDSFDLSKSQALRNLELWSQSAAMGLADSHLEWYWEFLRWLKILLRASWAFLLLLNLIISYKFLLARYQTYSMFYCQRRPRSKNVTIRSLNDLGYRSAEDISRSSLWQMIKAVFPRKHAKKEQSLGKFYYELRKWRPGKFCAALFSTFSPVCLIFLTMTEVSFISLLPLLAHQYLSFLIIYERYEGRLDDEACLTEASHAEINEKIIKPKSSVKTQDAMVDATPYGGRSAVFFPSFTTTRSHIFRTHTVTGDLITERYNPATEVFEDIEPADFAKNYVSREAINMQDRTPRQKAINGAAVRPVFWSRQPSPGKNVTPSRYMYSKASPASAPLTPNLKPLNGADFSTMNNASGHMNKSGSTHYDLSASRLNNNSRLRRNSTSPIKPVGYMNATGLRGIHRPVIEGDSSVSFSMDGIQADLPFEDVVRRGRRTHIDNRFSRDSPTGRSSAASSRRSSISPLKSAGNTFRGDTSDSRPPFR